MKLVKLLTRTLKLAPAICLSCLLAQMSFGQTAEPQREQLLNGLRVLLWARPGDQTVVLKLRIHSGAAFDTLGKAGTMALLGDLLFPDAATREYFTSEMGGRLDVDTDYDTINITLQGRATEYDRIVDILRGGLLTTPLTPENLTKVRDARIKKLSETKLPGGEIADQAVSVRLLGAFPYARAVGGTAESLKRVERADLMLARDRFLSPNNATIAIVGGVDQRRAMRALRQLLGGWRKNDQLVPATFRQPDPPDKRTLILNAAGLPLAEVRLATRGIARSDRDFFAASLLTVLARERWRKLGEAPGNTTFFARADAHVVPEMFVMGASVEGTAAQKILQAALEVLKSLVSTPASPTELEAVKGFSFGLSNQTADSMASAWLDIDTFGLLSITDQQRAINAISAADLQRVAGRLWNNSPIASVIVGNEEQLKGQFAADQIQLASDQTRENSKGTDQPPAKKPNAPNKTPPTPTAEPPTKESGGTSKPD